MCRRDGKALHNSKTMTETGAANIRLSLPSSRMEQFCPPELIILVTDLSSPPLGSSTCILHSNDALTELQILANWLAHFAFEEAKQTWILDTRKLRLERGGLHRD